ncbi:hypothetical protein AcV5_001779 [Taiwanofungus camphoratus]|nr:hypothetical protein AcV5_001779 [Antrodia cinnamomea]
MNALALSRGFRQVWHSASRLGLDRTLSVERCRVFMLSRQYTTSDDKAVTRSRIPHFSRNIETLDPHRLSTADYLHLSGLSMLAIFDRSDLIWTSDRCNKHKEEGAKRGKWKHVGNADLNKSAIYYWVDPTAVLPFPQGTDGFLYYYSNPRLSPMLGEIRFRITPSSSPKSFDEGADLLLPRGSPWCIPFLILVTAKKYQKLREVLLRDGLITNDLVDQCARVIQQTDFLVTRHHRYIHSLKYPFYMDFGSYGTHRVIGDDKLLHVNLSSPLFQERLWPPFRKRLPYTGTAMCWLERSTLPEHARTRTLVVRVLNIINPVQCKFSDFSGIIGEPKEGELICRRGRPAAFNVDKNNNNGPALRVLYERGG